MEIARNFRFWILVFLFSMSSFILLSFLLFQSEGVVVTSLSPDAQCSNVEEGFQITEVANKKISTPDELEAMVKVLKKGDYLPMKANNMPAGCFAIDDGDIGVRVEEVAGRKLRFSDEIVDVRADIFEIKNLSKEEIETIAEVLKIRANKLRLFQTKISSSNHLIKITNPQRLDSLFAKCRFEVAVSHRFEIENGSGAIEIGDNLYELKFFNESFELNNSIYLLNQSFYLEGIKFELFNVTNTSAVFHATVANNSDVKALVGGVNIRLDPRIGTYILYFPLEVSAVAEEKVKAVLKNIGAYRVDEQAFLRAEFLYSLDEKVISAFPILRDWRIKASIIPIVAYSKSLQEAEELRDLLNACLSSKILEHVPRKISTSVEKAKFTILAQSLLGAAILGSFIPLIKSWRKALYSLFPSFILLSQIVIIFGIAALTQLIFFPGWIIDLATLFGLLMMIGINLADLFWRSRRLELGKYILLVVGFVLLFTPFKGFGFLVVFWITLYTALTRPFLESVLKGQ